MKITIGHIVMPMIAILSGLLLVYTGLKLHWGLAWTLAGVFFITIGIVANLLTLAWVLPGPLGAFLRHPIVNVIMLASVVITLCATVIAAVFFQGH
jgi:hypothetical protein